MCLFGVGGLTQWPWSSGVIVVISVAAVAVLVAVGAYVVGKIHPKTIQREPAASELMSKFRELHSRGELNDAEFRTIKTTLAAQLAQELKDNGERGYGE